jgi:hypothetical protein
VGDPSIFISYRRDDAAGDAGRLADHLHRRFGAARVFLDIETIQPGSDFVGVLQSSLQQSAVALVVIGPRWASLRDAAGRRRLDDPKDFVRLEVEAALNRGIPVVPVLVQGASLPTVDELPPSLAPLVTRHAAPLDHADFHSDLERLCDRLEPLIGAGGMTWSTLPRRWLIVAAAILVVALSAAGYRWLYSPDDGAGTDTNAGAAGDAGPASADTSSAPSAGLSTASPGGDSRAGARGSTPADGRAASGAAAGESSPRVDALLAEAAGQRRRNQFIDALATLARARELAPASGAVREAQEDLAMYWIRNVHVERGKSTFADALAPALQVVDAALPTAGGARRADLLAHSGWAAFVLWRDGQRQLDPAEWYREALSFDSMNPYANAMLGRWLLENSDVPGAAAHFETALKSGRATAAVRTLQLLGYLNSSVPEAPAEAVRAANAIRRDGRSLTMAEASLLWSPYASALSQRSVEKQQVLLASLPPDEHIMTLTWAFDAYIGSDGSRGRMRRYYVALLKAAAGRPEEAVADFRLLEAEIPPTQRPLRDAVQAAMQRLQAVE